MGTELIRSKEAAPVREAQRSSEVPLAKRLPASSLWVASGILSENAGKAKLDGGVDSVLQSLSQRKPEDLDSHNSIIATYSTELRKNHWQKNRPEVTSYNDQVAQWTTGVVDYLSDLQKEGHQGFEAIQHTLGISPEEIPSQGDPQRDEKYNELLTSRVEQFRKDFLNGPSDISEFAKYFTEGRSLEENLQAAEDAQSFFGVFGGKNAAQLVKDTIIAQAYLQDQQAADPAKKQELLDAAKTALTEQEMSPQAASLYQQIYEGFQGARRDGQLPPMSVPTPEQVVPGQGYESAPVGPTGTVADSDVPAAAPSSEKDAHAVQDVEQNNAPVDTAKIDAALPTAADVQPARRAGSTEGSGASTGGSGVLGEVAASAAGVGLGETAMKVVSSDGLKGAAQVEQPTPNPWEHLDAIMDTLTPERRMIVEQLRQHPWFANTSKELQLELANLPMIDTSPNKMSNTNHDGFLKDLAARPDVISGVEVKSMERLARGNFGLIPVFNVEKKTTLPDGTEKIDRYTYEYFSWRYGPESGAKGAVLVRSGDKIVGFVVLSGEKFATGKEELDSVGGFSDVNVNGVNTMLDRIKREVQEELGQEDIQVAQVHKLGNLPTDAGMTNNRPEIFVAEISADDASKIKPHPQNPDSFELPHGAQVRDIAELPNILQHSDPYFTAAIVRAVREGILPSEALVAKQQ